MKANEYFKKHGYKKCKSACAENGWLNTGFWIQLKYLVKSHELIKSCGGLEQAKAYAIDANACGAFNDERKLKQAILDVESCQ